MNAGWTTLSCIALCALAPRSMAHPVQGVPVMAGEDAVFARGKIDLHFGGTRIDFSSDPLPPGTFGPGSPAFAGVVELRGEDLESVPSGALGDVHLLVRRTQATPPLSVGDSATVSAKVIGLRLVSSASVQVDIGQGQLVNYDVEVTLSATAPNLAGQATIQRRSNAGGTLDYDLACYVDVTFKPVIGAPVQIPGYGPWNLDTDETPWVFVGAPGTYDPIQFDLTALPPGLLVDGDGDGTFEEMTIGTSNLELGVADMGGSYRQAPILFSSSSSSSGSRISAGTRRDNDKDGVANAEDNCRNTWNPSQSDTDGDGRGDVCDPSPTGPAVVNEVFCAPPGFVDHDFIEIAGPGGMTLTDRAIAILEGDGSQAGHLTGVIPLHGLVIPANGLLVLGGTSVPNVDVLVSDPDFLGSGTQTVLFVEVSSLNALLAAVGSQLDPKSTRWARLTGTQGNVIDRVSVWDGDVFDRVYNGTWKACVGPVDAQTGGGSMAPEGIFRRRTLLGSPGAWDGSVTSSLTPNGVTTVLPTPGTANPL